METLLAACRRLARLLAPAALAFAPLGASCTPPPVAPPIPITIRVRAESGAPVSNVDIYAGPRVVANTDEQGLAHLFATGAEGATFVLQVKCPPGFRSPTEPVTVRRFDIEATTTQAPEYAVTCHETRHILVVGVRTDGAPGLPIVYLGKEIGRTDRSGAAHVRVEMDVHDRIEFQLSTAGKEYEKVHPQNPTAVFEMPDHDDFQIFDASFSRDKKIVRAAAPKEGIHAF